MAVSSQLTHPSGLGSLSQLSHNGVPQMQRVQTVQNIKTAKTRRYSGFIDLIQQIRFGGSTLISLSIGTRM